MVKLVNQHGMEVWVSAIGCTITRMLVPDAAGKLEDVVLGYDKVEDYVAREPATYFGVVVGRVANRIAGGKFSVNGKEYTLITNNGPNHLHGGTLGLHKRRWQTREIEGDDFTGVELYYESVAGEEGYPGNALITVTYKLAKRKNQLSVSMRASVDEATPIALAQHSYFNLAGHNKGTILDHKLTLHGADHFTPVDKTQIPTGRIEPTTGGPMDFTTSHVIGERISQVPGGYDHNFVLFGMGRQARFITNKGVASERPKLAATLTDPQSGRTLEVLTTAPGVQFYSGNFLDGVKGKSGAVYPQHGGLCLETQTFPDSVNQPEFPDVVLQPGSTYRHDLIYNFK